jgi:hypothetical protein
MNLVVPNVPNSGYAVQLSLCPCVSGYACQEGLCYPCRLGEYCPAGSNNPNNTLFALQCPPGQLCKLPNIIAPCPNGSICPTASFFDTQCQNIAIGAYCPGNSTTVMACAPGNYCPSPAEQLVCPKNYFCKGKELHGIEWMG